MLGWIRCMHTRQFSLENSMLIWDSIFLDYYQFPLKIDQNNFPFIDAMCVAMFMYLRSLVITKDRSAEIQKIYQKYPPLEKGQYLQELLSLARSLGEEMRSDKPVQSR